MCTFVLENSDINTPEVSMALNNISNFAKKSYLNYKQTTIIADYFSNKLLMYTYIICNFIKNYKYLEC